MSILQLTERASQELRKLHCLYQDQALWVGVDAGGCHGFQYTLMLRPLEDMPDDAVVLCQDLDTTIHVQVHGSRTVLALMQGATLDYASSLLKSFFVMRQNPQANNTCSCEKSFSVARPERLNSVVVEQSR